MQHFHVLRNSCRFPTACFGIQPVYGVFLAVQFRIEPGRFSMRFADFVPSEPGDAEARRLTRTRQRRTDHKPVNVLFESRINRNAAVHQSGYPSSSFVAE